MTADATHHADPVHQGPDGGVMRRLNLGTALVAGVALAVIGNIAGRALVGHDPDDSINLVPTLTMVCWAVGFMAGMGAFTGPARWFVGRDLTHADEMFLAGEDQGIGRYFRFTTDHKVVGIQYLVLTMVMLGAGGTMAMLIRTNLISPNSGFLGPQTYNSLVGIHGLTMILATIIMVTGPFGNFVVPLMIGARDMAFPRLNALSFWLLVAMLPVLYSAAFLGGIPMGWTGYTPLADQGPPGVDSYMVAIVIFAISTAVSGMNITTTILTMRARGMTWNRTPIFVYGVAASVGLAIPAFPMFMAAEILLFVDRTMGGGFYVASRGGQPWLYQNLFWLMGHPEVYVIVIPAVAALMELTAVFARKPLYSFNVAVLSLVGIVGLSVMVWAHHMFATGWASNLNGAFMLTTELISIPTGGLFLVIVGTIWRGRIWTTMPMMCTYAMLWNFIIGGVTGIYLSDVPLDYALHGSMFVTAHFHYTLMGAGLTGAIGAMAYWFPKMTGRMLDKTLGFVSFWFIQIGFNVTFLGMFMVGLEGQPRRVVHYDFAYGSGNFISTIGAYAIGIGMLVLLWAVISSWRGGELAPTNPWGAKTLEWTVPNPIPLENFPVLPVVTEDAYGYGESPPQIVPAEPVREPERVPVGAGSGGTRVAPDDDEPSPL
ncbi:MAG: cbb3-type cytochrome c oxidase subunit I [Actinomycetota bacterium]|nr:cbb3-type cytochrome c oxidase subunit I [Actinomycetota bacterium]